MADEEPFRFDASPAGDSSSAEISALRSEIEKLKSDVRSDLNNMIAAKIAEAFSKVQFTGDAVIGVSGKFPNIQFHATMPPLVVQATATCEDGQIVINWQAQP